MATQITRLMNPTVVPSTAAAMVTAAAGTYVTLKKVTFANTTAAVIAVTLYLVPTGSAADTAHTVLPPVSVPANGTVEAYIVENHVLIPGDALYASAPTTGVNMFASGYQVT